MPLYSNQNLLFIHIWKTGGTSLSNYLEKEHDFKDSFKSNNLIENSKNKIKIFLGKSILSKHTYALDIKKGIGDSQFEKLYKIAFVRNPYDWLVSWYSFVSSNQISPDTGKPWRHHLYPIIKDLSFDDFIIWVTKNNGLTVSASRKNSLFKNKIPFLQKDWITDLDGNVIVDYIGRYEYLKEDSQKICCQIGINFSTLPKINVTNKKGMYKDYYTKETSSLVYAYFREDFELFGYDKL